MVAVAAGGLILVAVPGCGSSARSVPMQSVGTVRSAQGTLPQGTLPEGTLPQGTLPEETLPQVTGDGVRALWQGAPWQDPAISDGMVLGVVQTENAAQVSAASAMTGEPKWTLTLPKSLPQVLGLLPAGNIVLVEAGRAFGRAPAMVYAGVTEYIAVDATTGHQAWAAPGGGQSQNPPIAVAGDILLTGDPSGAVTARLVTTGQVVWHDPRPCSTAPSGGAANAGLGIAADGSLAVASFDCGPVVTVQRLDAATGKPLWSWTSPAVASGAGMYLSVTAAARNGSVVLLTGQVAPVPAATEFLASLPRRYPWPALLAPADRVSLVLALDAADGHPRWSELGGQQETIELGDGAVCETVNTGMECRDDTTGATTMPDLVTGQEPYSSPPYVSGGIAAIVKPSRAGAVTVRMVSIQGGATVAQARLALGLKGSHGQPVAVAAGPLPGGATLVLLRRVDGSGFALLALRFPAR